MGSSLSINGLPAARRAAVWRDAVCQTFVRLDCKPDRRAPMHGRIDACLLGNLHVARIVSSPQQVERTATLAATADEAFVLLSVQLRGRTVVRQGAAQAVLTPGSLAFYDTTRAYTLDLPEDFEQLVLHLPHAALEQAVPGGLDHMARCIAPSQPFAQAIVAIAPQLLRLAATAQPALAARTAAAARELIALALESLASPQPATGAAAATAGASSDALVWRGRDAIGRRLAEPLLAPAGVAAELGVSLRRLQEAFQLHGCTLVDCIWDMRLEFARALLVAQSAVPISGVADRAGFSDPAHFSRRFRQRYGLSPRDYRQAAQTV